MIAKVTSAMRWEKYGGLLAIFCVAPLGLAANPVQPASTKSVAVAPSPQSTPAPLPQGTFNPEDFPAMTSSTLPLENGQRIVMRVNGTPVTWDDFITRIRLMGASVYEEHPGMEPHIAAALGHTIKDELTLNALFRNYAERNRLMPEQREVQAEMKNFVTDRAGRVLPAASLLTPPQIEAAVTNILVRQKVNRYIGDQATSTTAAEADVTSYSQNFRPAIQQVPILRASHIVFRATPDMSEFNRNDAKARAGDIRLRLDDGNTTAPPGARLLSFSNAARRFSQDRLTAYLGGDFGYFAQGTMYPEINEALAKLEPGEISPVVKSPVGYHILQLTERHPDDLRLLYDRYRREMAVRRWQSESLKNATVEDYLNN